MPAAVFSVERTLLAESLEEVVERHLAGRGLIEHPAGPEVFPAIDAWHSGLQASEAAVRATGWPVAAVARVAGDVADELADLLRPAGRELIDEHRRAGHRLVLASQTPQPLLAPLAARFAIHDVVAPVWAVKDGAYTGELESGHPWGRGKLVALRHWAKQAALPLRTAHAYVGTACDANVLAAVGLPVAVNPDAILAALARLEGWPIRHLDGPPEVVRVGGRELQEWFRPLSRPELVPNANIELRGVERIPRRGPVILVFNHRSYFDGTAVAVLVARAGRNARFLGKRQVFDAPVIGRLGRAFGGIPVDRSSGSDEPLAAAADALAAGQLVCLAPQGTIPRGPAFFEPELKGRWGAARLAARTGAPVVPVGLWGTERVWPRSRRLPRFSWLPPPVTVTVGSPVELGGTDPDADTRAIMAAIVELLPPEARIRRAPTPAELRRTLPPGYRGDPSRESERRPGLDT